MPTRISKLRIAGFKSFAEPVSLDILPGLTGIVGPNGCGKSNVVEALRWAMGETSARSLRGGEMDDVIFAGTNARASRNLAEVTVTLDGDLPPPFAADAELQVTRRIERGAGSSFRINGREQRARDVQTLYADLASGARSSGMVSQGRVSQLVNARPEERRQVLEEAAGITGLHARRHEAELKLRAAEQNLSRSDDVRAQFDASRESVRKQAHQATRYRAISGLIRAAEAEHLSIILARVRARSDAASAAYAEAQAVVQALGSETEMHAAALEEAEQLLPTLREALSHAERLLHRRQMAAEALSEEAGRVAQAEAQAGQLLAELQADLDSAEHAFADAQATVARLEAMEEQSHQAAARLPADIEAARAERERREADLAASLAFAERAAAAARMASREHASARDSEQAAQARAVSARALHEQAASELAEAEHALVPAATLADAEAASNRAQAGLTAHRRTADEAEAIAARAARAAADRRAEHEQACLVHAHAERTLREADARAASLGHLLGQARAALQALLADTVPASVLEGAERATRRASEQVEAAEALTEDCAQRAEAAQRASDTARRHAADVQAQARLAEEASAGALARSEKLRAEVANAEQALGEAMSAAPDDACLARSAAACDAAARQLADARRERDAGQLRLELAIAANEAARTSHYQAQAHAARLAGEADGLEDRLADSPGEGLVWSAFTVPDGLEAALGAALGDGSEASLNSEDSRFWRELPEASPLNVPPGATRLSTLVQAPAALDRLLAACFLIRQEVDGAALQPELPHGGVAVRADGACWRWDGRVARPDAPNPAAQRLLRARRHREARLAQMAAEQKASEAAAQAEQAHAADNAASAAVQAARTRVTEAETAAQVARETRDALRSRQAEADAVVSTLQPALLRLAGELRQAEASAAEAADALARLEAPLLAASHARDAGLRAQETAGALEAARAARQQARLAMTARQEALGRLRQRQAEIEARIAVAHPAVDDAEAQLTAATCHADTSAQALAAMPDPALSADALQRAEQAAQQAREASQAARAACIATAQLQQDAESTWSKLRLAATNAETRLATLAELCRHAHDAAAQNQQAWQAARQRVASLPDLPALEAADAQARDAAERARDNMQQSVAELQALIAERDRLAARLPAEIADLAAWRSRLTDAADRAAALRLRTRSARDALQAFSAAPDALATRAGEAESAVSSAQSDHATARDRLAAAEQAARTASIASRDSEQRLARLREDAVRAQAAAAAASDLVHAASARVADRIGDAADLPETPDCSEMAEERARRRFERLTRERDEMGPVNLRADLELSELEARLSQLDHERDELATAIAKLRGAIGHLNREGRARLAAVFNQVDQHFRNLFTRMMGGGRAHLALTGSDDPLEAGLEIYAEPPGKKLSSLALLSGGEQALTALSLIFAVFRCTPAPISVLDEVDAPLDDANVDRFCTLLDDVVRETGTRFLVVTHHQLTMSRMDRLFGVTMQERGVSRLLSVDLRQAEAYAAEVPLPAIAAAAE